MYASYEFYTTSFFGSALTEVEFSKASTRASAFLDYYTRGKSKLNPDLEELKMACCAIAEQFHIVEKVSASATGVQSESVGSWSRTYRSGTEISEEAQKKVATLARQYLGSTGLLYRGGCCR